MLITGAGSGLGKYLHRHLGGMAMTRQHPFSALEPATKPYEAIIHCAFNMRREIHAGQLYGYLEDTLFLTREATAIPHRKFILISTVDVYPRHDHQVQDEDSRIDWCDLDTPYALCKLAAESIVQRHGRDWLILRPGLLLGPGMRANNVTRVVRGTPGPLSLTADSEFRCVLYADILAFLRQALAGNLCGIFNAVRSDAVTMGALAARFDCATPFGHHRYRSPRVGNGKIARLCPQFAESAMQAVETFALEEQP